MLDIARLAAAIVTQRINALRGLGDQFICFTELCELAIKGLLRAAKSVQKGGSQTEDFSLCIEGGQSGCQGK
jgi:hypothetical protein